MSRFFAAVTLLSFSAAPALALPACAPPVEIHDLAIMRVEQNGVLVATDGRAVKLEGVRLPGGATDHAPAAFAGQALSELSRLATGHLVTAAAQPPKEDRYGRLRAQAFETDGAPNWIQTDLLESGLARVSISPDRQECVKELYAAEADARARRTGIWASPAYAVR
ncbi:MAG: thermonuclease family protein, partial [Rhizomicrobium sp.]